MKTTKEQRDEARGVAGPAIRRANMDGAIHEAGHGDCCGRDFCRDCGGRWHNQGTALGMMRLCEKCPKDAVEWVTVDVVALLDDLDEAERQIPVPMGHVCVVCTLPIVGQMRGMGDGSGQRFACEACYWRSEAKRLAQERDAIARARDCSALDSQGGYEFGPEDGSCALPAGNTCDRHLLMAASAEAQRLQRLRVQQTWPGVSPGRKKMHLMLDEAEAREEDARRELEKAREELRARDCGAEPHDPCALPSGNICDAHTIAELHRELAVAQEKRPDTDGPFVNTWPSANLQAAGLVDALPEYQLAPVEREAPARVLAVLTRR